MSILSSDDVAKKFDSNNVAILNIFDLKKGSDDAIIKCNVEIGDIFLTRSSVKPEGIAEANVLLDAGIQEADLLIAVTGSDEKNLLSCVVARKAGHCQTIARIRNPIYNEEQESLIWDMHHAELGDAVSQFNIGKIS